MKAAGKIDADKKLPECWRWASAAAGFLCAAVMRCGLAPPLSKSRLQWRAAAAEIKIKFGSVCKYRLGPEWMRNILRLMIAYLPSALLFYTLRWSYVVLIAILMKWKKYLIPYNISYSKFDVIYIFLSDCKSALEE
jgi:hypothetical protein